MKSVKTEGSVLKKTLKAEKEALSVEAPEKPVPARDAMKAMKRMSIRMKIHSASVEKDSGDVAEPALKRPAAAGKGMKHKVIKSGTALKRPAADPKIKRKAELEAKTLKDLEKIHMSMGIRSDSVAVVLKKTKEDLASKKNSELKDDCAKAELKTGGPKEEMIDRLFEQAQKKLSVSMVEMVLEAEEKAREAAEVQKARVRAVEEGIEKELRTKQSHELKDLCIQHGLKIGGSNGEKIERLLNFRREQGEVDRGVSAMVREEQRNELLSMDKDALLEICQKKGVDPIMKELMVDRILAAQ